MNKNILAPIFFILLVLALIYNINHSNKKIDDFFILHKKIANIVSTNKNLIFLLPIMPSIRTLIIFNKIFKAVKMILRLLKTTLCLIT